MVFKDPYLDAPDDLVLRWARLALSCTTMPAASRPSMNQVLGELVKLKQEASGAHESHVGEAKSRMDTELGSSTGSSSFTAEMARAERGGHAKWLFHIINHACALTPSCHELPLLKPCLCSHPFLPHACALTPSCRELPLLKPCLCSHPFLPHACALTPSCRELPLLKPCLCSHPFLPHACALTPSCRELPLLKPCLCSHPFLPHACALTPSCRELPLLTPCLCSHPTLLKPYLPTHLTALTQQLVARMEAVARGAPPGAPLSLNGAAALPGATAVPRAVTTAAEAGAAAEGAAVGAGVATAGAGSLEDAGLAGRESQQLVEPEIEGGSGKDEQLCGTPLKGRTPATPVEVFCPPLESLTLDSIQFASTCDLTLPTNSTGVDEEAGVEGAAGVVGAAEVEGAAGETGQ
ncbi:unnamed protein product [Closterium sp. NIES-64]|nr:unnamed protein product [Closterium sp. NIES-64]